MVSRTGASLGLARARLLLPFACLAVVALVLGLANVESGRAWEAQLAAGISVALIVLGLAVPWPRLPVWSHPAVPLAYLPVVALLRDSHGGAVSGFSVLCVLPVFWIAMFGSRRQLAVALAGVAVTLFGPILVAGGERYPLNGVRGVTLLLLVLAIVGNSVQALVSDIKRRARVEREHVRKLTDSHQALQAVAELAREITSAANPRRLICETAVSGAGASLATLVEPDGRGGFDVTGSAGIPIDFDRLRASVRPNASLRAYYSRTAVFVPDVAGEEGVSPLIVQATGLSSIVYEPIIRQERPVGILCVGWAEPRSLLDERTAMLIAFLAAEAGAALERADLVAQLDDLAHTDTLTGLPNRRQWDRLAAAAVRDSRSALCAAIIDLDHFKEFNDRHGHQAGDELLRTTAQIWRSQLRDDDLLARYGGEEFALLLRGPLAEAERVVERLRASTPTVTCSAGIAERLRGESLERLVERADKALYDAKRSGRDRLVAA